MTSSVYKESSGFNFDNAQRNALLINRGVLSPKMRSTGTTLAGCVFKDGVVIGADTRATSGSVIAEKNTRKLRSMAPNIGCAGSGTSADCEHVCSMVTSALTLHRLDTGREIRVITAETILKNHLRRYDGHVGVGLILGGVDLTGPSLFTIFPHGSTDSHLYSTMGSGCLNAMSILETGFKENMEKEEAMKLIMNAIRGGIFNDLGSGSNVDLMVITKEGAEMFRNYQLLMGKTYVREKPFAFPHGKAQIQKEKILSVRDIVVEDADVMDTS